jgi:hypothetical protein
MSPAWSRVALLELAATGRLRRRAGQAETWDELAALPWTRRTSRRDELELVPERRTELEALLDRVWLRWRETLDRTRRAGLRPDERGVAEAARMDRAARAPAAPARRLHVKTAAAAFAAHSKAALPDGEVAALAGVELTDDGLIRLRPSAGLALRRGEREIPAEDLTAITGEVVLTDRALRDGTHLAGRRPRALLLVENLGAYVDLAPPDDILVAHVPGWNTAMVRQLLDECGGIPVLHFGDLDPAGWRIHRHLLTLSQGARWFAPSFWGEYVDSHGLPCEWPEDSRMDLIPLARLLAERGLWLEHEVVAIDARIGPALGEASADPASHQ